MRKRRKIDRWNDPNPDIRETKRRLSCWMDGADDQMHKINMINAQAHGRSNANRRRR